MSRRSPRLEAGGYYQSDEDSDTSSEVTSVSYKETPVRVFKKRASRASSRASSVASSIGPSPPPRAVQRTRVTAEPPPRRAPPLPMLCPLSPDPWSGLGPALPENSSGYSSSEPNATALTAAATARDGSASRPASSSAAPNTDIIPKHLRSLGVVVLVVLPCVLSLMTMSGWFSVMTSPDQSSNHLPSSRPMVQDVGVSLLEERVNQLMMQLRKDRDTRGRDESAASDQRFHLDQEVKAISTRLDAQEALNAQMALELERVQSANDGLRRRLEAELAPAPPTNYEFTPDLRHALEEWLKERMPEQPVADQMADFALESQGASVVSTRCSENYRSSLARVTLFGIPLWYPSESPRTVLQGHSELLPGRCWAFSGVQGALVVALSHPVTVTHVTVDHLPRRRAPTGRIDSAPRHFQVYGLLTESDSGCLLGSFTYDQHGSSSQTFQLPEPSKAVYDMVEVRVLSNWGHMEYTCLYRFRVHGTMTTAQ